MDARFLTHSKDLVLNEGASSAEIVFALRAVIESLVVMERTLAASITLRSAVVLHNPASNKLKDVPS